MSEEFERKMVNKLRNENKSFTEICEIMGYRAILLGNYICISAYSILKKMKKQF